MIIGTQVVKTDELLVYVDNPTGLVAFVEDLVPVWARHISCLAHNQRFYTAIHLRNVLTLPYKVRMSMATTLLSGIQVRGIMSSFTPITDILDICDKEALIKMLEQEVSDELQ